MSGLNGADRFENENVYLIAVWHTKETRHLIKNETDPEPRNENQQADSRQDAEETFHAQLF